MKASAFEFRFRLWISFVIIVLGFWAPWIEPMQWGTRTTTWLCLGFHISALGVTATTGIVIATWLTIAVAAVAALLRVCGTAYLGAGIVNDAEMKAGLVIADGPYRYLRNPLYLGSWLMAAAIATLMPPTGATVCMVLLSVFLIRIVLAEEAYLTTQLGEPYTAYKRAVPRLLPGLGREVAAGYRHPNWGRALLSEITPIGVLVSFAALSWDYNSNLLIRAIIVSFGLSLIVKALLPAGDSNSSLH